MFLSVDPLAYTDEYGRIEFSAVEKSFLDQMRNGILKALPEREIRALLSCCRRIRLSHGAVLFDKGEPVDAILFPETAVIAVLGSTTSANRIEVWTAGPDGMAGASGLLNRSAPFREVVEAPGEVLMADAAAVRESYDRLKVFNRQTVEYLHRVLFEAAQLGVCNSRHTIEQRLCRWLLLLQDRSGRRSFDLTQDFVAEVLGARRASISVALARLQLGGSIRTRPGCIAIVSRRGLIAATCACYRRIRSGGPLAG